MVSRDRPAALPLEPSAMFMRSWLWGSCVKELDREIPSTSHGACANAVWGELLRGKPQIFFVIETPHQEYAAIDRQARVSAMKWLLSTQLLPFEIAFQTRKSCASRSLVDVSLIRPASNCVGRLGRLPMTKP